MRETIGFDLDGVISLLPFNQGQVMLTRYNEKFFWFWQKFKFLQKLYNYFFRVSNAEIRETMKELKENGFRVIIISAESESWRQELEKWLPRERFCFDRLYLKTTPDEDFLIYKKRMTSLCDYYFDDKLEVVNYINNGNDSSRCIAFVYKRQKKEELLKLYLLPLSQNLKTA